VTAAEPRWHADYVKATDQAIKEKKDLVIYFRDQGELDDGLADAEVKKRLEKFACLRVPTDYKFDGKKLLDYPVLEDMQGKPGLVVVSYHDRKLPTYGSVISAHPYVGSRYRWVPAYGAGQIAITLDLPAIASLSQRSMIYAVRVHPEVPQSVFSVCHPAFLEHAQNHSRQQANTGRQHHANLGAAMGWLQGRSGVGFSGASEVVAESWGRFVGGENVLEASFSCINAWRGSPGHWGSVSRRHSYFGYDIAQSGNGTWYATGIFAD
jgi:hypothetical protein